jgi:kojibiose phosphorylase
VDDALNFFNQAISIDFDEKKGGASEGIHIANCGGIWQAVVYGFAGMSRCYENENLKFNPHLPPSWNALSFPIVYRGECYRVKIDDKGTNVIKIYEDLDM